MTSTRVLAAAAAALLAGCAAPSVQPVRSPYVDYVVGAPFDEPQAKALMQPGAGKVTGSAFMRQRGGGVVTCAGSAVRLVPGTAYAVERFTALNGTAPTAGSTMYRGALETPARFTPEPLQYVLLQRSATCDAQGRFKFDNVPAGQYFVVTRVSWRVGYAVQGGDLSHLVTVQENGPDLDVVLSP